MSSRVRPGLPLKPLTRGVESAVNALENEVWGASGFNQGIKKHHFV